jgi:hypothetical protein
MALARIGHSAASAFKDVLLPRLYHPTKYFTRVELRDEHKLKYSWDSTTDGKSFLEERAGGILKKGFEFADRQFEFLAYSLSPLR